MKTLLLTLLVSNINSTTLLCAVICGAVGTMLSFFKKKHAYMASIALMAFAALILVRVLLNV